MAFVIAAQFVLWRQHDPGVGAGVLPRVGDIGEWDRVSSDMQSAASDFVDQSRQFGDDLGGGHRPLTAPDDLQSPRLRCTKHFLGQFAIRLKLDGIANYIERP